MVVLVLGSPVLPSKNHFVKALRELHPEISTVIVNVNDKRTSMVLGDKEIENGTVSVRERHEGDLGAWPVEQLVEKLREAAL